MKTSIGLKGASGLGDTIYGYPIVKYYSGQYNEVYYMSDYPELFTKLKNVHVYPHKKLNYIETGNGKHPVDIRFTYCGRKYTPGTSQYQDSLMSARVPTDTVLKLDWNIKNESLVYRVRHEAEGRKICIVAAPYEPFGRVDEWGREMRIDPNAIECITSDKQINEKVYFIQIGNQFVLHRLKGVRDLINKTTVSDLMDLISASDVTISQIGNMLPASEALGKKNFIIFSDKGLKTENRFISAITPEKTVHYKKLNKSVVDNETDIKGKFSGFIGI